MRAVSLSSLLLLWQLCRASAEVFTAVADIENLLDTHQQIIDDLDSYVANEEKRISGLKRNLHFYKKEHEVGVADIPNYLGNPINAFTLIKRLTSDLESIGKGISKGTDYIKYITVSRPDLKYPTSEDLSGAAMALTRLKETYQLNVTDLADGKIKGVSYDPEDSAQCTPMSAGDCFELARVLYNDRDYYSALEWMTEALRKYEEEGHEYEFNKVDIYEYIALANYMIGEPKKALKWTMNILELDPNHSRAAENIPHFQKAMAEVEIWGKTQQQEGLGDESKKANFEEYKLYEKLCRGEMEVAQEVAKRLTCRYVTEHHPFTKLARIKVEQMYIKPDIFLFHDVMSDDEIRLIQDMARPRFKRAGVGFETARIVQFRISKSAWLKDSEARVVARVSRRVRDMTGLDVQSAEELQVVNYGVGGHYAPHFDFTQKNETPFKNFEGNRIATTLFYMSDVAQGGATVFTELGLSVFPVKNAAVFWLNLHPSGEGDLATRHAACPVLRGSKWVSNKWLHQGGQELLKPCDLEYQEEGIAYKIAKAVPKTLS